MSFLIFEKKDLNVFHTSIAVSVVANCLTYSCTASNVGFRRVAPREIDLVPGEHKMMTATSP
jgi:hypothetical protein